MGQLKELGFGVQELGVAFRAKELVAAGFNKARGPIPIPRKRRETLRDASRRFETLSSTQEQLQAFPKIGLALKKDGSLGHSPIILEMSRI